MDRSEEFVKRPGKIYLFDFNRPNDPAVEVKINADASFKLISPHGLSIWIDPKTGVIYLYVVSHIPTEIIDKFRFDEKTRTLTHLRRITGDPNFHQVNDITVVGEDQFYFTNWFYAFMRAEMMLGVRWGSVGFFDVTEATLVDTGMNSPNGVQLSADRKYLYVSHCGDEEIRIYRRHENNSLTFSHAIKVKTSIDNIDVNSLTGDIWFGSHPVPHKTFTHLENPASGTAPSQVIRIRLDADSKVVKMEEIYSNDGIELSASTVAVAHGNGLLIGTVASNALYCEMNAAD